MVRTVTVEERRRALVRRHHLDGAGSSPEEVASALVGSHATDPEGLYLSVLARSHATSLEGIAAAMYERRSMTRWLTMRLTLFVFPVGPIPMVQAAISTPLADVLHRRLVSLLTRNGSEPAIEGDVSAWIHGVALDVGAALEGLGSATGAQLSAAVLELRTFIPPRVKSDLPRNVTSYLLTWMSTAGLIVRGTPTGAWTSRHHRWQPAAAWWPEGLPVVPPLDAEAALAHAYLDRFGPVTVDDLTWWTGWTKTTTRRAPTELSARSGSRLVDVDLHGAPGIALASWQGPQDPEPAAPSAGVATLLPALDPTAMGYTSREWFLAVDPARLFDTRGNIGPTVW